MKALSLTTDRKSGPRHPEWGDGYQAAGRILPRPKPGSGKLVQKSLRVGSWIVDPSLNSMSFEGRSIRLEPKVMEVLLCLAERPGKTLSKEQLFQAVWPNVIVTEDALKRCIADLRRAFDDDARNPQIIETISKRGYRLLAPVSALAPVAAPALPESALTDSIVVLPFANMSPDPENGYFADGITEEIIDALAQIQGLHVVARSSAFSFKGKFIDLRIVGEQLKARTVLEGSVRRVDNRVRITVQLVSTADGYHLWSERYDRELKDVFAIQEEIAQAITQRLKFTFPWREKELVKTGTPNLEAYQSYLKGRALLYKGGSATSRALLWFRRAVEIDPNYALAWPAPLRCGPANLQAVSPQHSSECERSVALSAISSIPTLRPAKADGERSMHKSKCAAMHGNQGNNCLGERPL